MAKGLVINKFKQIHRTVTNVVGFANVLDLYDYLGDANITVQTAFGFQYVQNFMGFSTVFLLSDEEIPRGRVIATPVENIVLYYVEYICRALKELLKSALFCNFAPLNIA